MAENTAEPQGTPSPISADAVSQRLQNINQYIDSNLPNILEGIDEADQIRENTLALRGGNRLPQSFPKTPAVNSLISGDIFQGPNPGIKYPTTDDLLNYGDAILNKGKLDIAQTTDPYFFSRETSFDASRFGYNFDRYYRNRNFKKLNFSIYRDNETLYNENSTLWDDFARMRGQYMGLWGGAIVDTWKNYAKFGFAGDSASAANMEERLAIATSSKEGLGAWMINFGANSAYTVGVISSIALESAALAAASRFAPGLAPMAAYRTGANIGRLGKSFKLLFQTMKNADKARSFFTMAKGTALRAIPFSGTARFINKARQAGTAENRLSDMAKLYQGFGSFYREMREINAVTSESRLEGGFAQNAVADKLLKQFYEKENRNPTPEEAKTIYDEAYAAGEKATQLNIPAIYLSNKVVLATALRGFRPVSNILNTSGMKNALFRLVKNDKGLYDVVSRGFKMPRLSLQGLKSIPSKLGKGLKDAPLRTIGSGIRYANANIMEGLQELYQEGLQEGVVDYYINDYYTKLNGDPYLAGKDALGAAFSKGLSSQMSKQGLDVFLSGFLMGGAIQAPMQFAFNKGTLAKLKIQDWKNKTDKYNEYIKGQEESLKTLADALNDVRENRTKYAEWLDENVKLQRDLAEGYSRSEDAGDRNEAENNKDDMMFMHVVTLAKSNKLDFFVEQLEGLKDLKIDELQEAFADPTAPGDANNKDIYKRIDTAINKAKQIKNIYENVNDRIDNPFNPDFIDKNKNPEQYAEEYANYQAVEHAKLHASFSEYTFMRSLERMESLANKSSQYAPIKDVESYYWSALYGAFSKKITGVMGDMDLFKTTLTNEIEVLNNGTPKQQEEGKKKQKILDAYNDLVLIMNNYKARHSQLQRLSNPTIAQMITDYADSIADEPVIDEVTGQMSMFSEVDVNPDVKVLAHINNEIRDAYKEYVKAIASATDTVQNDNFIDDSVQNLIDFVVLDNQAKIQARNVNLLADPQAFMVLTGKIADARMKINERKAELAKEGLKKFREYNLTNTLIQRVADLKIFFDPEHVDAFINENKFPPNFIDGVNGNKITESDPRFNQILDLFEQYEVETGKEITGKPEKKKPAAEPAAAPGTAPAPGAPAPASTATPGPVTNTTPYNEIPDEALKAALKSEFEKSGATGTINDWMLDSPTAAALIDNYNKGIVTPPPVSPELPPEEETGEVTNEVQKYSLPDGSTRTTVMSVEVEDKGTLDKIEATFESRSSKDEKKVLSGSGFVYSPNSGSTLDDFLNDYGFNSIDDIKNIDPALEDLTYDNFKSLIVHTETSIIAKADKKFINGSVTFTIRHGGKTTANKSPRINKPKFTAPAGYKPAAPGTPGAPAQPAGGVSAIPVVEAPIPQLYERKLELSEDEKTYVDPAQESLPEEERDSWERASAFKPHPYKKDDEESSDNLDADRGTIIDNVLRLFAVPLAPGAKPLKDTMITASANRTPSGAILGIEALDFAVKAHIDAAIATMPGTKVTYNPTFVANLRDVLLDLAEQFKDYTWYTSIPTLYGNINDNNIAGTIDLLLEKDGKYFIVDLKTSKIDRFADYSKPKSEYKENDRVQLNIYAELFKQLTGIDVDSVHILPMKVSTSADKKILSGVELTKRTGKGGKAKVTIQADKIKDLTKIIKKGATPPKVQAPPPTAPVSDIERRIQESINSIVETYDKGNDLIIGNAIITKADGTTESISDLKDVVTTGDPFQRLKDKINSRYKELAALEGAKPPQAPAGGAPTTTQLSSEIQNEIKDYDPSDYEIVLVDGKQTLMLVYNMPEKIKKGFNVFYSSGITQSGLAIINKRVGKPITIEGFEDVQLMMEQDSNNVFELTTGLQITTTSTKQKEILNELKEIFETKNVRDVIKSQPTFALNKEGVKIEPFVAAPVQVPEVKAKKAELVKRLKTGETVTGKIEKVPGARTKHTFTDTSGNVYEFYNAKGLDPVLPEDISSIATVEFIGDITINDKPYTDVVRVIVNGKTVGNIRESTEEEFEKRAATEQTNTAETINSLNFTKLQLLATSFFGANETQKKAYGKKVGESMMQLTDDEFIELYLQRLNKLAEEGSIKKQSVMVGITHLESVSGRKLSGAPEVESQNDVDRLRTEGNINQQDEFRDVYNEIKDKPNSEVRKDFFDDLNNCNPKR